MPAPDASSERSGRPLLTVLFWSGVGTAPIAAVMLLFADGNGPLRIAAVLAVLSVVLIGLSMALRADSDTVRNDLEATLFDEIDGLHQDVRRDIETAARATHQALGQRLQELQRQVDQLRAELALAHAAPAHAQAADGLSRDPYREPEETGHGRYESRGAHAPSHGSPRDSAVVEESLPGRRYPKERRIPAQAARGRFDSGGAMPPVGTAAVPHPPVPGGVVHHTETVHVTTRHTIVDTIGDVTGAGTVYGGALVGRAGGGEYDGRYGRAGTGPEVERDGPDAWAGARWVSGRVDEWGREVSVGERRAAMRTDGTSAELRFEDRWAAVRQDQPRSVEPYRMDTRDDDDGYRGGSRVADHGRRWDDGRRAPDVAREWASAGGREASGQWPYGSQGRGNELADRPGALPAEAADPPARWHQTATPDRIVGPGQWVDFGPSDDRWR